MSKNKKNKDKDNSKPEGETPTSTTTPRTRQSRGPMAPLQDRLCGKADTVYSMVGDMAKTLAEKGAPRVSIEAASAFVAEVEKWREIFFSLKNSGWAPATVDPKAAIVEGDPIQIRSEYLSKYAFIEGLADGTTKLVAGAVEQMSKLVCQVMLKDESGKFYGYAPRKVLARR